MARDKKLLIYLMIRRKLDLKPFTNQNKIKQKERDLKYYHQIKYFKDYQQLLQKAGNNSESLLNEIRQIVYSLYQSKQITKKVYNKIIKSIQ